MFVQKHQRRPRSIVACTLALTSALASNVAAQTYRDALVQAPTLAPPTRGSVAGTLASLRYGATELARGTFHLPSPFSAPSDRGPMLASAFPSYSPDVGLTEWGMGWGSDLAIKRFRSIGTLDYATDEFVSPWGRLVQGNDGAFYPAGLEERIRVTQTADGGWRATHSDGSQWLFRVSDSATNARGRYQWNLSEVISAFGDRTSFTWEANASGRLFVREVQWGGRGATREMRAVLQYQPIAVPIADFSSGVQMLLDRRVTGVSIEGRDRATGTWSARWSYNLQYDESPAGAAFYLASVTRTFASGQSDPAFTYSYTMAEDRLTTAPLEPMAELDTYLARAGGSGIQPEVVSFFDLEDDGRVDMEHQFDQSLIHHGDEGWSWEGPPSRDGTEDPLCRPAASNYNRPRLLVRMRPSASEPNVVVAYRSGTNTGVLICDRQGHALHREAVPGAWDLGANTRLVDLDRDLRPDFVRVFRGGYEVLRNTSDESGFHFQRLAAGTLAPLFTPTATWAQDVNGDGLADLVARNTANVVVWFGTGGNRFQNNGTTFGFLSTTGPVTNLSPFQITFTDANHDGLADALLSQGRYLTLFTNRGSYFRQVNVPGFSSISWTVGLPVAVDLDGRGEEQAVLVNGNHAYRITLSTPDAGLMVRADDGRGGFVTFDYERARPTPGIERRPPMLKRMRVEATGEGPVEFSYDYEDAAFHSAAKYLLGFGTVRRDGSNSVEAAEFHFDDDISGLLVSSAVAGTEGDLFRFERRNYDEASFRGVRTLRLLDAHKGWSDASGAVLEGTVSTNEAYEGLCVTRARNDSPHGSLTVETTLASLPALGDALHCTPREIRNIGSHPGRADSDFTYRALLDRNDLGLLTRMTAVAENQNLVLQEVEYDAQHRVAALRTPSEGRSTMSYDPVSGLLVSVTSPDGVVTSVQRDARTDAFASLTVARGPGGAFTRSFGYDGVERLTSTWDNVGSSSATAPDVEYSYRYADRNRTAAIFTRQRVDAAAVAETIELAAATGATLSTAVRTSTGWAFDGLALHDPNEERTDRFRRAPTADDPLSMSFADLTDEAALVSLGSSTKSVFGHTREDISAVQENVIRQSGERLSLRADGVLHESLENGQVVGTRITDGDGHTTSSRDALGAVTTQTYDALDRLIEVSLPGGAVQKVRYDAFGRIGSVHRSNTGRTEHSYDALGRMQATRLYDTAGALVRTETREYDDVGRVVREHHVRASDNAAATYTYGYDEGVGERGHLTSVTGPGFVRRMKHTLDGRPSRTELTLNGFRTIVVQRTYAEDGSEKGVTRIVSTTDGQVLVQNQQATEYDALGRVARRVLDGDVLYELSYDDEGRVSYITFANGEIWVPRFDPLTHEGIGYDHIAQNWSLGVEVSRDARGLVSAESIELTPESGAPVVHDREYSYDARRFLTERRGTDGNSVYTYDGSNRLASAADLSGSRSHSRSGSSLDVGSAQFTYDAAARVVRRNDLNLTYGPHGEIERATRADRTVEYIYDESGLRLLKRENGQVTAAFVDGAYLTASTLVEPVQIEGRLVGVLVNGSYRSIATDPRGTVIAREDGSFIDASPYGQRTEHAELAAAFDYVQQGFDPDLGTVRMGVRDYDPLLGEFWTPDPLYSSDIARCANDPVQCTLYAYASNDPVGRIDPNGTEDGEVKVLQVKESGSEQVNDANRVENFEVSADSRIFEVNRPRDYADQARSGYNSQVEGRYEQPWWDRLPWRNHEIYVTFGPSARVSERDVEATVGIFKSLTFGGYFPQTMLPDSGVSVRFEVKDAYALTAWGDHVVSGSTALNVQRADARTWNVTDTGTISGSGYGVTGSYSHSRQEGGSSTTTSGTTTTGGGQAITLRGRLVVGRVSMVLEKREGNTRWRERVWLGYRRVFQTGGPGMRK